MTKKPDGPSGKGYLVVPDAMAITAFVKQARQAWHAAHPIRKNKAGRPLAQASDLSRAADSLVRVELKSRHRTQLFSKETAKRLIQTLAEQFIDCDESTIRRQVALSLLDEKSLSDLTGQDKAFLRTRRKGEARSIEQAPAAVEALIQRFLSTIKREFPDQWKAAEQTDKPLTMGEIKRLYAAKENGRPLTLEMLRPTSTPRR